MKSFLGKTYKYIFLFVTVIQAALAFIWLFKRGTTVFDTGLGILSIAVAVLLILWIFAGRFESKRSAVLFVLYILTIPTVLDAAVSKGHIAGLPDAPKASFEELMVQRFVWPRFFEMTDFSEYDFASEGLALSLSASPELLYTDYFPLMRENLSADELSNEYKERVTFSLSSYKKAMAKEMSGEFAAYFFAPVSVVKESFFRLSTTNAYARDYETFSDKSPILSKIYMRFGCISFLLLTVLGMLSALINKEVKAKRVVLSVICIGVLSIYCIFFPVRGFDYQNSIVILLIYAMTIFRSLREHN